MRKYERSITKVFALGKLYFFVTYTFLSKGQYTKGVELVEGESVTNIVYMSNCIHKLRLLNSRPVGS